MSIFVVCEKKGRDPVGVPNKNSAQEAADLVINCDYDGLPPFVDLPNGWETLKPVEIKSIIDYNNGQTLTVYVYGPFADKFETVKITWEDGGWSHGKSYYTGKNGETVNLIPFYITIIT